MPRPRKTRLSERAHNYMQKHLPIVEKLKGNVRALDQYRQLYNELCDKCRMKVVQDPRMPLEKYCPGCREKATKYMERVRKLIQ